MSVATLRLPDESSDSASMGFMSPANSKSGASSGGIGNSVGDGWLSKVLQGRWFMMSARYVALVMLKPMTSVVGEIRRGSVLSFRGDELVMHESMNQRAWLCLLLVYRRKEVISCIHMLCTHQETSRSEEKIFFLTPRITRSPPSNFWFLRFLSPFCHLLLLFTDHVTPTKNRTPPQSSSIRGR